MAFRRYRRIYRRPRRVSRFGRHTRRYMRNQLAAIQQRDIGRFTIKTRQTVTLSVSSGQQYAFVALNIWDILGTNPPYNALVSLFDQIKINGVRVSATSNVQPSATSAYLPTFVYAWDRNGPDTVSGTAEQNYNRVASYGSSRLQPITPGTHNSFTTYLVAQDLQERITYIGVDDMRNVTSVSQIDQLFFKPTLLIAVYQPVSVSTGSLDYTWECDIAIDVTFRGSRYAG